MFKLEAIDGSAQGEVAVGVKSDKTVHDAAHIQIADNYRRSRVEDAGEAGGSNRQPGDLLRQQTGLAVGQARVAIGSRADEVGADLDVGRVGDGDPVGEVGGNDVPVGWNKAAHDVAQRIHHQETDAVAQAGRAVRVRAENVAGDGMGQPALNEYARALKLIDDQAADHAIARPEVQSVNRTRQQSTHTHATAAGLRGAVNHERFGDFRQRRGRRNRDRSARLDVELDDVLARSAVGEINGATQRGLQAGRVEVHVRQVVGQIGIRFIAGGIDDDFVQDVGGQLHDIPSVRRTEGFAGENNFPAAA